ncbi:regulator of G-protein signaling rgs-2 isoform X2 [Procambarus clarkii]|uniref:regulator of G-protein signaling rgs-2 isoform X2 n=1 Tax=Procambarus clarkii TaxID=6728 RepID=UPI001E674C3F|nr:regulator of G-protein signaling rgs-2-like isoform X2 [Procambarus clarkii]
MSGSGGRSGPRHLRWRTVVARLRRGLNVKTADDHRHKIGRIDLLNGDNEPPPTIEDIRAWSDSFERLMKCSSGRQAFRDFLKCEYSEENILFWQACEELKGENNPAIIEEKARLIYEDYISILSPKEVSLDSRVREIINRNMVDPTPHTFDEAQTQIYTLMHRDSYPRFINSAIYKRLAQLNNNGSSSSSRKESST